MMRSRRSLQEIASLGWQAILGPLKVKGTRAEPDFSDNVQTSTVFAEGRRDVLSYM